MRDGYRLAFGAFDKPDAPKAQALKPLEEEAAEVYGAWQDCDDMRFSPIMTARREYRQHLIDECMDVVQAVVNLLDAEGFTQEDVDAAIERCNERNRERGRL
nr:MAG TPA: triphosphate pyrophosphohydrolase [Caudoviricetes sp.]